tara:strand:- start:260 stop:463 length:204 start_codon:yes stop_codon:yes gene_type:complete
MSEQLIRGRATYRMNISLGGVEAFGVHLNGKGSPRIGLRTKLQKNENCCREKERGPRVSHGEDQCFQ